MRPRGRLRGERVVETRACSDGELREHGDAAATRPAHLVGVGGAGGPPAAGALRSGGTARSSDGSFLLRAFLIREFLLRALLSRGFLIRVFLFREFLLRALLLHVFQLRTFPIQEFLLRAFLIQKFLLCAFLIHVFLLGAFQIQEFLLGAFLLHEFRLRPPWRHLLCPAYSVLKVCVSGSGNPVNLSCVEGILGRPSSLQEP